ncbi:PPE family protein [Mycobacterium parmense]|uniref:PPE family protein n=1 Tax=Mycobacterium parmense TaxID=185642 RepID=A0A7I7YTD3_9MYCO|nr:PPE family protein [Mycobacterium parmense]MCV7351538.1 PPE family protein [Mycobacterium parmense]ORW57505.1 hypothetical protein AWC20_13430 [Mycobacterium parmense]BBZ45000.1 PPE family protein [Mycobacterium parmense]
MQFATLPPEVNSGRIYAGAGAGPLQSAGVAWGALAARLRDAAAHYRSAIAESGDRDAAAPARIQWLNGVAAGAERAAIQAAAAAAAARTALAAVVPPPVIDANRARLMALTGENHLGQAAPAIAGTEAEYERMWAEDVRAMYTYAEAAAGAARLTPFASPPSDGRTASGGWKVTAAPEVLDAGRQVVSTIPQALLAMASSPVASLADCLASLTASLSKLSSLSAPSDRAIRHLSSLNKRASLAAFAQAPRRASGTSITARMGRSAPVGRLSAPPAWAGGTAPQPGAADTIPACWGYGPIRLVTAASRTPS